MRRLAGTCPAFEPIPLFVNTCAEKYEEQRTFMYLCTRMLIRKRYSVRVAKMKNHHRDFQLPWILFTNISPEVVFLSQVLFFFIFIFFFVYIKETRTPTQICYIASAFVFGPLSDVIRKCPRCLCCCCRNEVIPWVRSSEFREWESAAEIVEGYARVWNLKGLIIIRTFFWSCKFS